MTTEQLHATLERLCILLRAEARTHGVVHGLFPVQLEALHYLAQCNRYSDTVQAVTEFLGQTKGTVSQTIKALETRGLVGKQPDAIDRRRVHIRPTRLGQALLAEVVPPPSLASALKGLPARQAERLTAALQDLLRSVQDHNGLRSFGVCRTCRFNQPLPDGMRCGLTGETLSDADAELICREHERERPADR